MNIIDFVVAYIKWAFYFSVISTALVLALALVSVATAAPEPFTVHEPKYVESGVGVHVPENPVDIHICFRDSDGNMCLVAAVKDGTLRECLLVYTGDVASCELTARDAFGVTLWGVEVRNGP